MSCYLDNAATTALSPNMKEYLISMLDVFGNPSSAHSEGVRAKILVEEVREKIAKFIKADSSESIYFTSSGSASNALGIQGYVLANTCNILYSPTTHKSILKTIDNLVDFYNVNTVELKVDQYGNIDIKYLYRVFKAVKGDTLVVAEYANSEIGTVQDIKTISDIVHKHNARLFVDCTGSISTIPLDVYGLDIDMCSFSAHKIGALKGIGILYKKNDIALRPLIFGSQEHGLFAGTENLLGILSIGKAIDLIRYNKISNSRDFVWNHIKNINDVYLIGSPLDKNRLLNNLYICIKGVKGQDVVAMMDDIFNTQISTGSACNNGAPLPSSTLLSIGVNKEDIHSCIRISFNGDETKEELQKFCKNLFACVNMLRG